MNATGTSISGTTNYVPPPAPAQTGFWYSLAALNLPDDTMFILTRNGKHNTQLSLAFMCGAKARPRTAVIFVSLGIPWKIMKHVLVIRVLKDKRYELGFVDELPACVLADLDDVVSPRITSSTSYKRAVAQSVNRTLGFGIRTTKSTVTENLGNYVMSFKHGVDDPNQLIRSEAAYISGNGWGALRAALEVDGSTRKTEQSNTTESAVTPANDPEARLLAIRIQELTREIQQLELAVREQNHDAYAELTCMRLADIDGLQRERLKLLGTWVARRADNHLKEALSKA
jgi:hypothetical protein